MKPVDSNGRNGKSASTGPRTPEGKAKSAMNAVKHGLTAQAALIPGEDPAEFKAFVADVVQDLRAEGPVQQDLARRAAVLMWKRRRLEQAEAQVIGELAEQLVEGGDEEEDDREERREIPVDPEDPLRLVRFITADEFAGKERQLARLEHYDRRLGQQLDSTIRLLLKLQNRKQYQEQQERRESDAQAQAQAQALTQAQVDPVRDSNSRPAAAGEPDRPGPEPRSVTPLTPPPAPVQNKLSPGPEGNSDNGPPEQRPGMN